MLMTSVLHSALLLGFSSASLVYSGSAFAQGNAAPADPKAANPVYEGIDPLSAVAPLDPTVDPRISQAQIADAFGAWLKFWQKRASRQRLPQPFPPQTEKELAYIEQLLTYWDGQSEKDQSFRAEFTRWVTDPVFGPAGTFKTFSKGEIQYEAPDKGLYRIDSTVQWTPPTRSGGKPTYLDMGDGGKEQWICDGKSLFEFNYAQKKLVERQLPPEMQGKAITEGQNPFALGPFFLAYGSIPFSYGPFPFVFGANKEAIQSRYWLRVPPNNQGQKGEYRLEAYPKFSDDAVAYTKIEIVISGSDFFPSAIKIYERNNVETIYQFTNRSVNGHFDRNDISLGRGAFSPTMPDGWERLVEPAPHATAKSSLIEPGYDPPR